MTGVEVDIPTDDLPLKIYNLCEIAKEIPRDATLRRWTLRADYRITTLKISSLSNVTGHQIDQKYVDYHHQIFSAK